MAADVKAASKSTLRGPDRTGIERASSRYKAALYSLALFQLSYPKGPLFGGVPHSPSLAGGECGLQ
jgi:hypothetical protein